MFGTIRRKGFCQGCVQNTLQIRRIESPVFRALDYLTLRASTIFQIGPWYCTYCGANKLYLRSPVSGIRDFEADKKSDEAVADEMPVGNFISRENSLLGTSENADRFSRKYRDAVIIKLMKGQATISQMCNEINVSERDLMTWLREYVNDQQQMMAEEIQQLKLFISEANQETIALNYREQIADSIERFESQTPINTQPNTIEGRIIEGPVVE